MSTTIIDVKRLPHAADLPLPSYAHEHDAGMDLHAAVSGKVTIWPGERRLIPTGLAFAIPPGAEMQIRSRSGLALKSGIVVANAPGTIDAGYRGEVGVILLNVGHGPVDVHRGDRIAQAVIAPVIRARLWEVAELPDADRGAGGFGSTGVGAAA